MSRVKSDFCKIYFLRLDIGQLATFGRGLGLPQ
jgi:hypothetical protein